MGHNQNSEPQVKTFVGIDVSAASLSVCARIGAGKVSESEFENTPSGHEKLIQWIQRFGAPALVGLEWTGSYSLDAAIALVRTDNVSVSMLNPRAVKAFSVATGRRAKTDRVDAACLAEYVQRMEVTLWEPPNERLMALRSLMRRIADQTVIRTAELNRAHAARATAETPSAVIEDIEASVSFLDARIEVLLAAAVELVEGDEALALHYANLCTIKGVGRRTALLLLSELLALPADMSGAQVAAFAGLDPRTRESGTSVRGAGGITKRGNGRVRAAMYLVALTAGRHDPAVREFRDRLVERGKRRKVAAVATSRRLLVVVWAIIRTKQAFRPELFRPRGGSVKA